MISAGYKSAYQQGYSDAMRDFRKEPKTDTIDKIRAEIDDLDRHYDNDYFSGNKDAMFKCDEVMQIIDKYKAESEVQDADSD